MFPTLEARGGKWMTLSEREGRRLTLSKASLGEFVYEVLKAGGEIAQLWAFNATFDRSQVLPVVAMTPAMRDAFEAKTGWKLVDPPTIHVNNGKSQAEGAAQ